MKGLLSYLPLILTSVLALLFLAQLIYGLYYLPKQMTPQIKIDRKIQTSISNKVGQTSSLPDEKKPAIIDTQEKTLTLPVGETTQLELDSIRNTPGMQSQVQAEAVTEMKPGSIQMDNGQGVITQTVGVEQSGGNCITCI